MLTSIGSNYPLNIVAGSGIQMCSLYELVAVTIYWATRGNYMPAMIEAWHNWRRVPILGVLTKHKSVLPLATGMVRGCRWLPFSGREALYLPSNRETRSDLLHVIVLIGCVLTAWCPNCRLGIETNVGVQLFHLPSFIAHTAAEWLRIETQVGDGRRVVCLEKCLYA